MYVANIKYGMCWLIASTVLYTFTVFQLVPVAFPAITMQKEKNP